MFLLTGGAYAPDAICIATPLLHCISDDHSDHLAIVLILLAFVKQVGWI